MSDKYMQSDDDIINNLRMDVVRLESKLEISDMAVIHVRTSLEKRLDHMNEFREALREQAKGFVTRGELFGFLATASIIIISLVTLIIRLK